MDVDPLASMRCWAIEMELGGRTFEVPALPAIEWWPVIASGDLDLILDFVSSSPDDPDNIDDMILSGSISAEELTRTLTDVVEEIAGRSFHAAIVLARVANAQWASVNGSLVQSGFRWDQQPLGAALDALYEVIMSRLEKDNRDKFLALLDSEALTTGRPSRRQRAKIRNEFETMAGPRPTTGVVATDALSGSARPRTQPRPRLRPQGAQSVSPKLPRVGRVGSARQANSVSLRNADELASDTVPPLLPATH